MTEFIFTLKFGILVVLIMGIAIPFVIADVLRNWALGAPKREGFASWMGCEQRGRVMENGQPYVPESLVCASWDHEIGTMLRVTNRENGLSVLARVSDRGPDKALYRAGRVIELSERAFDVIADPRVGVVAVSIAVKGDSY